MDYCIGIFYIYIADDDLDTTTVILNLLLWPMIIVYLLEELRKRNG